MGTCYTYLLFDVFDWDYRDESKEQIVENLKAEFPVATVLATWPHYLVVDMDKSWPLGDRAQALKKYCDVAYCYPDTDQSNIQEVKFKRTKTDEQTSKHRNQKYIDEANAKWLQASTQQ